MIDKEFAEKFTKEWISAFNSHDLERIFELYDDDFTMTSPFIKTRMSVESGVLKGKKEVWSYWEKSLAIEPPLRFELIDIFIGVSSLVVLYKNIGRKLVCETFTFNSEGKVISGISQHGPAIE